MKKARPEEDGPLLEVARSLLKCYTEKMLLGSLPSNDTGLGPPKYRVVSDWGSLTRRVGFIVGKIKESVKDPVSHQIVAEAVRHVAGNDQRAEVETWFNFLKSNIRYTMAGPADQIPTLRRILTRGVGDCDNAVVAVATGLTIMGYTNGARVTSFDCRQANHIYNLAWFPRDAPTGVWPLDLTIGPDGTPDSARPWWEIPASARCEQKDFLFDPWS